MVDSTLVESSFSATINAPIEEVDIPAWCFTPPEAEYQSCSPAHCSAGATTSLDGRRISAPIVCGAGELVRDLDAVECIQCRHSKTTALAHSRQGLPIDPQFASWLIALLPDHTSPEHTQGERN
jgi:hypothetical protein